MALVFGRYALLIDIGGLGLPRAHLSLHGNALFFARGAPLKHIASPEGGVLASDGSGGWSPGLERSMVALGHDQGLARLACLSIKEPIPRRRLCGVLRRSI